MEVRKASRGDEAAVVEAIRLLYEREAEPAAIPPFLQDPFCLLYLALEGGRPVGCLYGYELRRPESLQPVFFLYRIDVLESHWRRGIGRALVDAFLSEGRARGGSKAWVQANCTDTDAQEFYCACGGKEYSDTDVLFGVDL